jgi:hypothetical protein
VGGCETFISIVSPHNRFKSLGPESLPRSPAFQDDGGSQARLFAQILDRSAFVPEGLQKKLAIKLGLHWLTACRNAQRWLAYHIIPPTVTPRRKHASQHLGDIWTIGVPTGAFELHESRHGCPHIDIRGGHWHTHGMRWARSLDSPLILPSKASTTYLLPPAVNF